MQMTGNTILITGGGSGIGRGLAEALHTLGNQVIISGRRQNVLDEVTAANPGMKALTVNMADKASIQAFAAKVAAENPALNVLVNMAGIMVNENLQTQAEPLDVMEATVATNLVGPMRLTAALLPALRTQPNPVVMTVTSGLAFVPLAMTPTYCATKAAIHSYTESLRYQLKDTNVQVIELIPPYVQTTLMGDRQASDPNAMPLTDYIAETMSLLTNTPDAPEIVVERVKSRRFAERSGGYEAFFQQMNDAMMAARASEMP